MDLKERNGCLDNDNTNVENIPKDTKNFVFFVFFYLGITFVFPYNMLISVNDFWNYKFRNVSIPSNQTSDELTDLQKSFPGYLALSTQVPTAVVVILTAFFGKIVILRTRVILPATLMALIIGAIVTLAWVNTDSWQNSLYNLVLVINTLFFSLSGVYEASLFGNIARFPARYIGFTHVGVGLGLVLPSLLNIILLATNLPLKSTSILGLSLGLLVMLMAVPLYHIASKTAFYQYHSGQAATNTSNPKFRDFLEVVKTSWVLVGCVFLTYATYLSVFPALAALVKPVSQEPTTWNQTFFVPVCCFLVYNTCDWLGRSIGTFSQWPGPGLSSEVFVAVGVLLRMALIPLIMMCNLAPKNRSSSVMFPSDVTYILVIGVFGVMGGYLGNVALMLGQKKVRPENQEAAGLLMTAMLVGGLGVGAGIGPVLVSFL